MGKRKEEKQQTMRGRVILLNSTASLWWYISIIDWRMDKLCSSSVQRVELHAAEKALAGSCWEFLAYGSVTE
jgi:hypothetical protein